MARSHGQPPLGPPPNQRLPHDVEAEEGLLGAVMLDAPRAIALAGGLEPEAFSLLEHRPLWRAMTELVAADRPVDPVTLRHALAGSSVFVNGELDRLIVNVTDSAVTVANAGEYARIIRDCARQRRVTDILDRARKAALAGDDAAVAGIVAELSEAGASSDGADTQGEVVDFAAWQGQTVPQRRWLVCDWLPAKHVTALYGDGGTGKTRLAQQLMTCHATGRKWLGLDTAGGRAFGLFGEDDAEELLRRQEDINTDLGIDFRDLEGMKAWSLCGADAVLMTFDAAGNAELTPTWFELRRRAKAFGADLIVIDGAADTFGGNENIRGQVRAFIRACLGRLAVELDATVLLLAHPSRAGLSTGTGDSGSTAWSNSVRSRLYLSRPDGEDDSGDKPDDGQRVLSRKKSNYAAEGDEIRLLWRNGVWVPQITGGVVDAADRRCAEAAFVACLDAFTAAGRWVSSSPNSGTYAPKLFARAPERQGFNKRQLERAMEALFSAGKLRVEERRTASRNLAQCIVKVASE